MKKVVLLFGLIVLAMSAYSQDFRFTKGDLKPGALTSGRDYEDFISGFIKVTDGAGNQYRFVKADVTVHTRDGKKVQYALSKNFFNQEQSTGIIEADDEGTFYTFTGIVVQDNTGKQYKLPDVKYHLITFAGK